MSAVAAVTLADAARDRPVRRPRRRTSSSEWLAATLPRTAEPGEILAEQGEPTPVLLLCSRARSRRWLVDDERVEPVGRQYAPTWMGAIGALTGRPARRAHARPRRPCRCGIVAADEFRRLALAAPVGAPARDAAGRAGDEPHHGDRAEPRAARLARHDGRRARARAQQPGGRGRAARPRSWPRRWTSSARRSARFVESGIEREEAAKLVALQREALERAAGRTALDALDAADAEDDAARAARGARRPRAVAARRAARGGRRRRGVARAGRRARRARRPTPRSRWVAATLAAHGLAAELQESTRRMSSLVGAVKSYAYMDRGERGRGRPPRGPRDDADRARPQAQAHGDPGRARLRPRPAEAHRARLRAQPGVDEPARQRHRRARRVGHDHDHARAATATARRVDIADDGPGIPAEIRERVFDSFFTTKEVGSGTASGSTTARRIVVDRHDGALTVESEPGPHRLPRPAPARPS